MAVLGPVSSAETQGHWRQAERFFWLMRNGVDRVRRDDGERGSGPGPEDHTESSAIRKRRSVENSLLMSAQMLLALYGGQARPTLLVSPSTSAQAEGHPSLGNTG